MEPKFTEVIGGLAFPEGPVCLPDGSLIIVELAAGTISRITPDGKKHLIAKPGGSPNGAAIGPMAISMSATPAASAGNAAMACSIPWPRPKITAAAASSA